MENLQLNTRDVHVRYEDDVTNPQQISAMGLTLESLAARTCDEFWSPKFVHRDPELGQLHSFKIVSMTNMAAYLDCPAERYSDLSSSELATVLSLSTTTSTSLTSRQCMKRSSFSLTREMRVLQVHRGHLGKSGNNEALLYRKMYDKFALDFNMQIIVK